MLRAFNVNTLGFSIAIALKGIINNKVNQEETQIYDNSTYVSEYTYLGIVENVGTVGWRKAGAGTGLDGSAAMGQEKGADEEPIPVLFAQITQRNKFCVGDEIEIMKPDGRNIPVKVQALYDEDFLAVESAPHSKQELHLELVETETGRPADVQQYDLLRVANS